MWSYSDVCEKLYLTTLSTSTNVAHYKDALNWVSVPLNRKERLARIIKKRQGPLIVSTRTPLVVPMDIRETRARETLRLVIGEEKYKRFISHGFVSVKGRSGKIYQIFPGHGFTKVYEQGQMIDRLCVVLSKDFPPTDSVIVRYLMVLNDEAGFWKLAVKHGKIQPAAAPSLTTQNKTLVEIFKELKLAG